MDTFLTVKEVLKNTTTDAEGVETTTELPVTFTIPFANISFCVTDETNNQVKISMNNGTIHLIDGDNAVMFSKDYPKFLNKK
jgi:uncharacterized surface protein with fasciclin (FAS1) repeats